MMYAKFRIGSMSGEKQADGDDEEERGIVEVGVDGLRRS